MKNVMALLMFAFFFCNYSEAQNAEDTGTIYFFRLPVYSGSAAGMTIFSNGQPIVRLKNASYFKYPVTPGDYIFSFAMPSGATMNLRIEPGKEYFIKCYLDMGLWSGIPVFEPVEDEAGRTMIKDNRLAELDAEQISVKPLNSRIGLQLSGGAGFDKFPWFLDQNGDEVNLSTGGGFGIGLEYGYRPGKNFDIEVGGMYLSGSLSEKLKNVSASFTRFVFTATPSFVIPLRNDQYRIRLGAGPSIYTNPKMKVDAPELGYDQLEFRYKAAAGFHVQCLFETSFSERGAMSLGIRYTNASYRFIEQGSSMLVPYPDVEKPSGAGIDFILGYCFHF